ncbi:MAG: hypothetical protein WBX25_35825 [Rhodomicrobium sp.]
MKPNSKPSTLRMRRYRWRRKIGAIALPPQHIEQSVVTALRDLGWLDPELTHDPRAINDAIMNLVCEYVLACMATRSNRALFPVTA